jgi:hypothetical protein
MGVFGDRLVGPVVVRLAGMVADGAKAKLTMNPVTATDLTADDISNLFARWAVHMRALALSARPWPDTGAQSAGQMTLGLPDGHTVTCWLSARGIRVTPSASHTRRADVENGVSFALTEYLRSLEVRDAA